MWTITQHEGLRFHDGSPVLARDVVASLRRSSGHGALGKILMANAERDDWLFNGCSDAHHASGTCRMGTPADPRTVVDPNCRVLGAGGQRVIDASIMPEVPRANTHLTTVAIAERKRGSGAQATPHPRENHPNILGFCAACPPGDKGGVVVIGAAVDAGNQHSLGKPLSGAETIVTPSPTLIVLQPAVTGPDGTAPSLA